MYVVFIVVKVFCSSGSARVCLESDGYAQNVCGSMIIYLLWLQLPTQAHAYTADLCHLDATNNNKRRMFNVFKEPQRQNSFCFKKSRKESPGLRWKMSNHFECVVAKPVDLNLREKYEPTAKMYHKVCLHRGDETRD